jgi:hypothetical protein
MVSSYHSREKRVKESKEGGQGRLSSSFKKSGQQGASVRLLGFFSSISPGFPLENWILDRGGSGC